MGYWRLHQDPDLSALQSVWERAQRAGAPCVFRSFAMARHWARAFADIAEVLILVGRDARVILPFALQGAQLQLIGEGLFDYQDVCGSAASLDSALWADAWRQMASFRWDGLYITGVPESSDFLRFWQTKATPTVFARALQRSALAPPLPAQHRRYARRWRKAREQGVNLRLETESRDRNEILHWLLDHKAARFGAGNVLDLRARRWLEAMVQHERDLAELWSLRQNGRILSGLLCWKFPLASQSAVRYAYTISYDQQAAELSPGVLLLYAVVCRSGEEGMGFDFLTGEQPFKQHFATSHCRLLRLRGRPTLINACRLS